MTMFLSCDGDEEIVPAGVLRRQARALSGAPSSLKSPRADRILGALQARALPAVVQQGRTTALRSE